MHVALSHEDGAFNTTAFTEIATPDTQDLPVSRDTSSESELGLK
jgi:hypothetical protein